MRAMRAETFSGYEGLKLIELPRPRLQGEITCANHRRRRDAAGPYDSVRQISRV